jgi:NTE family protein
MAEGERIGLVLSGGGSRAAYEVGALSVLLPLLEERGERPVVVVGTSAGAINAVALAAQAHRPAAEVVDHLRRLWEGVDKGRVIRPVLGPHALEFAARYGAELAGVPGMALRALLDPGPLERTLDELIDWDGVHRNVAEGELEVAAVVATEASTARSRVFVEGPPEAAPKGSQEIDYVPARIGNAHVRASSAIPTLFPAVRLEEPEEVRGWYFDGVTRLNAPIRPALDLGVDRVVIIGTHSVIPEVPNARGGRPRFIDGAMQLVQATLVDPLVRDVRMLGKLNLLVDDGPSEAIRAYRESKGKSPYRQTPYAFVAPWERGVLGAEAARVFEERYTGRGRARSPDLTLVTRLLGGRGQAHGELLSYLLFDPAFFDALMDMGRADAEHWVDCTGDDAPWTLRPIDELLNA